MALEAQLNLVADRGLLVEAQVFEILAGLIGQLAATRGPRRGNRDRAHRALRRRVRPADYEPLGREHPAEASQHPDVQESRRVRGADAGAPKVELLCRRYGVDIDSN